MIYTQARPMEGLTRFEHFHNLNMTHPWNLAFFLILLPIV